VVPAGKLELLLSEGDGLTTAALAQRANGSRDQVLTLLREMEEAGRVRRIGSSRATRWRAITDEERIAARAAQLAAQSRAARAKAGAD
jgi:DNA-binding Lrp family transcriptional regulator